MGECAVCRNDEQDMMIVQKLQGVLCQKEQTLAIAESCTGGYVAHQITRVPGASKYFLGSFVVYADQMKKAILRVAAADLHKWGAVSQQVAVQMAKGVLSTTQAYWVLAITGLAGPDNIASGQKTGTIWIALGSRKDSIVSSCLHCTGDRDSVIKQATHEALKRLYYKVSALAEVS